MPFLSDRFISLRARFMMLAVLLTLVSSGIWGTWAWQREKNLMFDKVMSEGEILVTTMAIPIINALLYEEMGIIREGGLLDNFVSEIMAIEHIHPLYAMVLDQNGRVLAHNRFAEFGNLYDDAVTRKIFAGDGFVHHALTLDGMPASDLGIPLAIAGKSWGCLRVGVSLAPLHKELNALTGRIVVFASLFSAGALIVFWIVGTWLARPIQALTRQMELVGQSALPEPFQRTRRDEIGQLQKSFAAMLDRLRRSEEERNKSMARLLETERIAAVGHMVSGVAHEINNPLAGIEGALYQMEQKGNPGVERYTALVRQSIERIGRIVSQLLDLSRVGAVSMEPVDSREFFKEIALFAKMSLVGRQCTLETLDQCPPVCLVLDKDKIHQVVLNLVINAADAMDNQGKIFLLAFSSDEHYCISVRDQGPGIPAELHHRIFETFFTTKEPGKGTGMGLALSKSIAESHGGTLAFESEVGSGTTFTLKFPIENKDYD
jgi:two-component system, NtrC family, sensor kinase